MLINSSKIAYARNGGFKDVALVIFLDAKLNVFPKVIHYPSIIGKEEGQGRYHIEAISFNIIDLLEVTDD